MESSSYGESVRPVRKTRREKERENLLQDSWTHQTLGPISFLSPSLLTLAMALVTGDPHEGSFLLQHLFISAIQSFMKCLLLYERWFFFLNYFILLYCLSNPSCINTEVSNVFKYCLFTTRNYWLSRPLLAIGYLIIISQHCNYEWFRCTVDSIDFDTLPSYDVADLLKLYFRELPECLLTNQLSDVFIEIFLRMASSSICFRIIMF